MKDEKDRTQATPGPQAACLTCDRTLFVGSIHTCKGERGTLTAECRCWTDGAKIRFCPLHAAAPQMREALEAMLADDGHAVGCNHRAGAGCWDACTLLRAALRAADGGES